MNPDQLLPRTPLPARLLSSPPSPRSSFEADNQPKGEMKLPVQVATSMASPTRANLVSPTFTNAAVNRSASNSPQPVVRWISSWSSTPRRSPIRSRDHSPPRNRPPSAPSSPILASLNEALSEPIPNLPSKPPNARLPAQFYASRSLSHRPPPLLDNLTRATFPTASLSSAVDFDQEPSSHISSRSDFIYSPPPVILSHPPKSRSSIDRLRSVHNRTLSTTASPQSAPILRFNWWWGKEDNVDPLLNEADRAETPQDREQIRKKCLSSLGPSKNKT
jgi:triacylglycerol lipase